MAAVCYRKQETCSFLTQMPQLLVTAFSARKFGFDPGSVLVGFAVDTTALGVFFVSEYFGGFPCQYHSTHPPYSCSFQF
jgi:hypothetical protein